MSQTISQLPAGSTSALTDIVPLTQGSTGPGTGTTRKLTVAKILSASEVIYAGDPAYAGGVVADGVTNDSTAWSSALSAAASTGAIVVAPIGVSVASFTIPSNVMVIGHSVESFGAPAAGEQTYTAGTGSVSAGVVIQAPAGSTTIITMSAYSQLRDIQVVGTGSQVCVDASAGRAEIDNVDISAGATGIRCNNVTGGSTIKDCTIHHHSGNGIDSPYGCMIMNNYISSCAKGIALVAGSNNNIIIGNKVAFCSGASFSAIGTSTTLAPFFNTFTGNMSDRAGNNAFLLTFAMMSLVSGNTCFRSGRGGAGGSTDAHFALTSCDGVSISSNATSVWADDSPLAIGRNSPTFAVWDGGSNVNCQIVGNVLVFSTGAGAAAINVTTTFNLASSLNVTKQFVGRTV